VITCFSDSHENLDKLISHLHNYYGSLIDQTIFSEKTLLTDSLKKNNFLCSSTQLFVIDLNRKDNDNAEFVSKINRSCPASTKLIIACNEELAEIKKSVRNNGSLLFLQNHWNGDEFKHALNIATETFDNPCLKQPLAGEDPYKEERIEEKVNKKLQKLIDANIAKDKFLSIISHDLKSPFVALQGISEILLTDWKNLSEETKLELIGDLHKTSVDTYKLLETLLEWTKLNKGNLELSVNEIVVHNLVNSTLKVSKNNASVKGIEIKNQIEPDVLIHTDKNILATIFRNLISNAVQYTQPGGNITISAKQEKEGFMFCVADNGPGIDQPHILEYFSRKNNKTINGNASAFKGLGLIICKDFVDKSGGKIWLETKKGMGSKFFFTIPS
jgi:signal transduction histidine kinase